MPLKDVFRKWLSALGAAAVAIAPTIAGAEDHVEQDVRPPIRSEVCDTIQNTHTTPPGVDSLHQAVWTGQNWLIVPRG